MSTPHCRIAFIKPSTDPEDKSETPYLANFTILLIFKQTRFVQDWICTRLEITTIQNKPDL